MKALQTTAFSLAASLAVAGLAWWPQRPPELLYIRFMGVSTNGARPAQVFEMVNPSAALFCYEGFRANYPVLFFKELEEGRWSDFDLQGCMPSPVATLEPRSAVKFTVSRARDDRVSLRVVGIRFYRGKAVPRGQETNRLQTMWSEFKFKFQACIGYTAPIPPVIWSEVAGWK